VEPSRFFFEEADLASPEAQKASSTLWKPGQSGTHPPVRTSLDDPLIGRIEVETTETLVRALIERLEKAEVPMEHDPLLALVKEVCKEHGACSKVLFHSLRYLLTGGKEGPGVVDTMANNKQRATTGQDQGVSW
jgi:glutamyl/glutaminyl-tRNA synthetase